MINATDCSDEEVLKYIQETRGEDELHWSWKWIIFRTLKILVRDYLERKKTNEERIEDILKAAKPGTLTEEEKKEIMSLRILLQEPANKL